MSSRSSILGPSRWFLASTLLTACSFLVGCQPNSTTTSDAAPSGESENHDHDHSDEIDIGGLMPIESAPKPETLATGVRQLVALRDTVAKGFADDDIDSIHNELHSVGNLLESVESLVKSSNLADEDKKTAAQAVNDLFDHYGAVDAKLHGIEGKDYTEVDADINAAVETLLQVSTKEKSE